MLRALSLAILMTAATAMAPTFAEEASDPTITAQQQNPAPQQTPRRDCEKRQEGVS
jgi:hypothetical protein